MLLLQQGLDEEHQKFKDDLVDFFMNIKDKVRIEEVDLQMPDPIFTLGTQNNKKCTTCNEFANIHCINCSSNVWLCVDHWRNHKTDHHA